MHKIQDLNIIKLKKKGYSVGDRFYSPIYPYNFHRIQVLSLSLSLYIYIYIYIYTHTEFKKTKGLVNLKFGRIHIGRINNKDIKRTVAIIIITVTNNCFLHLHKQPME